MFRRLAACMTENIDGFVSDIGPGINQANYLDSQSAFYGRDIIPTTVPVSQSIGQAFGTVNPMIGTVTSPNVQFVHVDNNPTEKEERVCQISSIDQLISTQDPSSRLRCGWVYTSPATGSSTPSLSQGALGTVGGPIRPPNNGIYQKWFWNLEDAKKQILIDRCKALKDCKDVELDRFSGCGFCPTLGQGIPVDSAGRALYPDSQLTTCSKDIITRGSNCPTAQPSFAGGTSDLCVPIGGRMPYGCIQSIITANGCTVDGALVAALSDSSRKGSEYSGELGKLQSMGIYNKVSEVPMNLDTFRQGTDAGLVALASEIKGLANVSTSKPANSKLGAAARDLCIRKGAMNEFDFCSELVDTTPPPFSAECLAKEFLKAGGQLTGAKFPWPWTKAAVYDVMPNWKAVRDYIKGLVAKSKGLEGFDNMYSQTRTNYSQQSQALIDLRGIVPEQLSNRAPMSQGVEVFWFNGTSGMLLNNTLEGYFPSFHKATQPIPQTRGLPSKAMFVALTDVRVRQNSTLQFQISSDDGFNISLNKNINGVANSDEPGYFARNFIQATTTYVNSACWNLKIAGPNVIHTYWNDAGGGEHTFNIAGRACGSGAFSQLQGLTLTREMSGPFLAFEGTSGIYSGGWGDLRMTDFFNFDGWGNKSSSIQIFSDTDSKLRAPGRNGFVRIKPSGYLVLNNVSPAAWTTTTFVFRLNEKPTRNALFELGTYNPGGWMRYLKVYMTNVGSTVQIRYSHNINDNDNRDVVANGCTLETSKWYMGYVLQNGGPAMSTQWTIGFIPLEGAKSNGSAGEMKFTVSRPSGPINAIANPVGYIRMGAADPNFVSGIGAPTSTIEYDIAWWHIFNRALGSDDFKREAVNDWQVTPTFG